MRRKKEIKYFVGVDVQINRGCCYYVLDLNKKYVTSGWIKEDIPQKLKKYLISISNNKFKTVAIGIDAPRMPLKKPRIRSFNRKLKCWYICSEKNAGRECEVIIKSYNIGNPQWTKTLNDSPEWMKIGYSIFSALKEFPFLYEVFPSASYKMLVNENVKYELCLNGFREGVKDMLDASVAAITVYEFIQGFGCEVGGEDGLGTIVLPRKIMN